MRIESVPFAGILWYYFDTKSSGNLARPRIAVTVALSAGSARVQRLALWKRFWFAFCFSKGNLYLVEIHRYRMNLTIGRKGNGVMTTAKTMEPSVSRPWLPMPSQSLVFRIFCSLLKIFFTFTAWDRKRMRQFQNKQIALQFVGSHHFDPIT